jgi:hypothetical protein
MIGFIYIMSNPLHPDVVKIGQSSKDPNERRKELGTTGVLEEFVLEYRALTENYVSLEKEIHRHLASVRVRKDREFFKISVPDAIEKIREIAGNRIESDKIYWVSEEEIQRIKADKQKKAEEALNELHKKTQEEEYEFQKIAEESKKRKDAEKKENQRIADDLKKKQVAKEIELSTRIAKEEQEKIRKHNRLDRKLIRAILSILKIIFYPYLLLWKLAGSDSFFLGLLGVMGCFPVAALYVFVYSSIF